MPNGFVDDDVVGALFGSESVRLDLDTAERAWSANPAGLLIARLGMASRKVSGVLVGISALPNNCATKNSATGIICAEARTKVELPFAADGSAMISCFSIGRTAGTRDPGCRSGRTWREARQAEAVAVVYALYLVLPGILVLAGVPAAASANAAHRNPSGTVYVNCWHRASGPTFSDYLVARAHPRTCTIWGSPEDLANENALRRLRWLSWGQTTTTLRGQVRNSQPGMGGPLWGSVTARLSRIRRGCDGDRFYTRITFPDSKAAPELLSDSCDPRPRRRLVITLAPNLRTGARRPVRPACPRRQPPLPGHHPPLPTRLGDLTTNRGIAEWGAIFEDTTVAVAILDRLLHYATLLHTKGTQP